MSRAYHISVRESLDRTIRAEDWVGLRPLEYPGSLPPEQMAGLLAAELEAGGYRREGDALVRKQDGVDIAVNASTGEVTVRVEACQDVRIEDEKEGRAYDEIGPSGTAIRQQLQRQLQERAREAGTGAEAELQGQVTDRLEGHLVDLVASWTVA